MFPSTRYVTLVLLATLLALVYLTAPDPNVTRSVAETVRGAAASGASSAQTPLPPLVLVHMGDDMHFLPTGMADLIRQAVRWNPELKIAVVMSHVFMGNASAVGRLTHTLKVEDAEYWRKKLTFITLEDLPVSEMRARFASSTTLDTRFRSGFWRFTAERLFVLHDALAALGVEEAFHTENDNMLYVRLGELLPALRKQYAGVALTPLGPDVLTAGFLYIHRRQALAEFLEYSTSEKQRGRTEMHVLSDFAAERGPSAMGLLPVVAPEMHSDPRYSGGAELFSGLFDGAAHGQYLGGHDPRNIPLTPPGAVNTAAPYRTDKLLYRWDTDPATGLRRVYVTLKDAQQGQGARWWPIYQLHVHCKDLISFSS